MFSTKGFLICSVFVFLASAVFPGGQSSAAIHDVSIIEFAFVPQTDTITVGDTVRWTNNGAFPHTSTSNTGLWNSGSLNPGGSFTFSFSVPDSYHYHCAFHPGPMTGTIVVKSAPLTHQVSIIDFAFVPPNDTITAGDSVRWTNNGAFSHTSTSNTLVWDSGILGSGQSFAFQFNTPGSYPYHCSIHLSMTGTIIVKFGFKRGDNNRDGVINLGDVVYLISYLYKGGSPPDPLLAGDVTCDGVVNLGDVVYLITYLYKGGPPPSC